MIHIHSFAAGKPRSSFFPVQIRMTAMLRIMSRMSLIHFVH
jgi:hypothetical protein